jgi:carbonic anhydrase
MEMLLYQGQIYEVLEQKDEGSIKVVTDNGVLAFLEADGSLAEYDMWEFHFHAPAEHSFNGHLYDLELHIVHKKRGDPNQLGVVGIFFDRSAGDQENEFISRLGVQKFTNNTEFLSGSLPLMSAVSQQVNLINIYRYEGSLTAPVWAAPDYCSENVAWHLLARPLPISTKQVDDFNNLWKDNPNFAKGRGNNRLIQPRNGRKINVKSSVPLYPTN